MIPYIIIAEVLLGINTVILIGLGAVLVRYLFTNPDHNTNNVEEFRDCLEILNAIIQLELEEYENDIFAHKGSITNANFDNYYHDICDKIIQKLQPKFVDRVSQYYSEEGIYGMVARKVKVYLASKINGTM